MFICKVYSIDHSTSILLNDNIYIYYVIKNKIENEWDPN